MGVFSQVEPHWRQVEKMFGDFKDYVFLHSVAFAVLFCVVSQVMSSSASPPYSFFFELIAFVQFFCRLAAVLFFWYFFVLSANVVLIVTFCSAAIQTCFLFV